MAYSRFMLRLIRSIGLALLWVWWIPAALGSESAEDYLRSVARADPERAVQLRAFGQRFEDACRYRLTRSGLERYANGALHAVLVDELRRNRVGLARYMSLLALRDCEGLFDGLAGGMRIHGVLLRPSPSDGVWILHEAGGARIALHGWSPSSEYDQAVLSLLVYCPTSELSACTVLAVPVP